MRNRAHSRSTRSIVGQRPTAHHVARPAWANRRPLPFQPSARERPFDGPPNANRSPIPGLRQSSPTVAFARSREAKRNASRVQRVVGRILEICSLWKFIRCKCACHSLGNRPIDNRLNYLIHIFESENLCEAEKAIFRDQLPDKLISK